MAKDVVIPLLSLSMIGMKARQQAVLYQASEIMLPYCRISYIIAAGLSVPLSFNI